MGPNDFIFMGNLKIMTRACMPQPVFFFLLFLGPKFGPIPLAKKYVSSPYFENSPQNEVLKKKSAKCDNSVSEVRINSFRALAMP